MSASAAARLAEKDRRVAELERREPLQRRILRALLTQAATPSDLAQTLPASKEAVSRQLKHLRAQGLVQHRAVPGDARRREYLLTAAGEIQLSEHRAFGADEPAPPDPTRAQAAAFLASALQRAVLLRRKTNKLPEAVARLQRIVTQARKLGAHEIALEATAELVTTLRQDHELQQAQRVLEQIERISFGQEPRAGAAVVPAAIAHREYALGWIASREDGLGARARHLAFAADMYDRLSQAPPYGSPSSWRERQGWSLIGLANNLRAQSLFEPAIRASGAALQLFDELDDDYGRSRCLFTFGFCLRLLGEYDNAWVYLEDSHTLAVERGFERFQADSLMQMGDVRRCQGRVEDARELLAESEQRAGFMHFTVSQAFALSALGALEYQQHDLAAAAQALRDAHVLFLENKHLEGSALNARRRATVVRRLAATSRGARGEAAKLIADALARYTLLRCPAGVVASEIEQGQLQIIKHGQAHEVIDRLIERLDDPKQRDLLEYDPWVPRVLASFARETQGEQGELSQRAARLIGSAQRRAQQARESIRSTVQSIGAAAHRFTERESTASPAATVDEMGGESRHLLLDVQTREPICF